MSNTDAAIVKRWKAKRAFYASSEALWKRRHTYRQDRVNLWDARESFRYHKWRHFVSTEPEGDALRAKWYGLYHEADTELAHWTELRDDASYWLNRRREDIEKADKVIARHTEAPLRERAYAVAVTLIGVMEQGGNNRGPMVSKIISANGGTGPEPWCGDFVAYCYRKAGSTAVQRLWASVYYLGRIGGLHKTSSPERGDLVRFTFDHVGMFVRDLGNGYIETIEGNTGSSGAVSDSSTGGDGVYLKRRPKSLVQDYLRVER